MPILFLFKRLSSAIRNPQSAIVLLLVGLALGAAACDPAPTEVPSGPPGPGMVVPTPTIVPTETPIAVTGTGAEAYLAAHSAMLGLKSYHFTTHTDLGRNATQDITGDWATPNKLRLTIVNKGAGTDATTHLVRIGGQQWTSPNDAATPAPVNNPPAVAIGPDQVAGILRYAGSVEKSGDVTLDGVSVQHLTFTLDEAKLQTNPNVGIARGSGELWIAPNTHYLLQMRLTFVSTVTAARGQATSLMKLSAFDTPVTIDHP